jgi:hypothetical protein
MNIFSSENRIDFTLNKLTGILQNYKLPEEAFRTEEDAEFCYDLITIGPKEALHQGNLIIKRFAQSKESVMLQIECIRKASSGYFHYLNGELNCSRNMLSTPLMWNYTMKTAKNADDEPYLNSGLTKEAIVNDGELRLTVDGKLKNTLLSGAYTCKWCLLDAI